MKTKTCIFAILLAVGLINSRAQDTWTQKANFPGGFGRYGAVGFSIGSKGYMGTGYDFYLGHQKDLWEYDPVTNAWTQKADLGGVGRESAVGFVINGKGYIGTGYNFGGVYKDFWEYDPVSNTWTQKADFGGTARYVAVGFSVAGKGYIGTGSATDGIKKDFWEYDPVTNAWIQKANFGGTGRANAAGFSVSSKGYIGTGFDGANNLKDFWEYDPSTDAWTQKADFGGTARDNAGGISIGTKGYFVCGNDGSLKRDFWEYDPSGNSWTQRADFGGAARWYPAGFSIGSKGYVGTGIDYPTHFNDFWEYTPGGNVSACLPPPSGLVSWWSGDRTAEDVQGTNNGVLRNGASFRPGKVGPGFAFDGIDDAVVIPNSPSLSPGRLTLDAWIYATGKAGTGRHIISKDNEAQTREYIIGVGSIDKFVADIWLANQFHVQAIGTTTVQLNTWYHVAMTQDGANLRLYVNGVLEATVAAAGDIPPTPDPVAIGGNAFAPVFFQGIIDEAQIFNRALTDAEILAIYQTGADGQCKPNIFVSSITPSFEVRGRQYLISTAVVIQDINGVGIEDATTAIKTTFPDRSVLTFPAITDRTGQATISFYSTAPGRYQFKVQRVSHPTRVYDPSLNVETSDTLVIP